MIPTKGDAPVFGTETHSAMRPNKPIPVEGPGMSPLAVEPQDAYRLAFQDERGIRLMLNELKNIKLTLIVMAAILIGSSLAVVVTKLV
ncbi:hypothetical protein sS8_0766 [Methylocaldum marinum]|uniref:Uncharacterized protein n=2 Tax=Methylocaldum marinum TaxID=1432792 RepID=A0A250KP40_9GAMM|nr:hypothetical protein sS8_0766 [Methylocaldum marinum]